MYKFLVKLSGKLILPGILALAVFFAASCSREDLREAADFAADGFREIMDKPVTSRSGKAKQEPGLENDEPPQEDEALFTPRHMETVAAEALDMAEGYDSVRNESPESVLEYMQARGLCACDNVNDSWPMTNIELVTAFFQDIESGREASLTVYEVFSGERLMRHDFICSVDWNSSVQTMIVWSGDEFSITYQEEREIEDIRFTEKGNILYTRILPGNPESRLSHDGYIVPTTLIRTKAIDSRCTEYEEMYLKPLAYRWGNMYDTDWSEGELSHLDFGEIFAGICGYDMSSTRGNISVNGSEFEDKFCSLLPITAEELRLQAEYSSDGHVYQAHLPSDHAEFDTPFPEPEVVGYRTNADGSLTLFVDVIFLDRGTDCAVSHELTLKTSANGGFRYVSNRVTYLDESA